MASKYDTISTNKSIVQAAWDHKAEDDNRAADKGKKPLSCSQEKKEQKRFDKISFNTKFYQQEEQWIRLSGKSKEGK